MRTMIILLIFALVIIQGKLWFGDSSIPEWLHLQAKVNAEKVNNEKLATRNHAVEADIQELKSGSQALEERARNELGMVKKDEEFYQFVE